MLICAEQVLLLIAKGTASNPGTWYKYTTACGRQLNNCVARCNGDHRLFFVDINCFI